MSTKPKIEGGILGADFGSLEAHERHQKYRRELAVEEVKAREAAQRAVQAEETLAIMNDGLMELPGAAEFIERDRHEDRRLSDATRATYKAEFALWRRWCEREGVPPLPGDPGAVGTFLIERGADDGIKNIRTVIAAISFVHRTFDFADPTTDVRVRMVRWWLLDWLKQKFEKQQPKGNRRKGRREVKRTKPTAPVPDATEIAS